MHFVETWFASPERARSRTKLFVYDDIGTLSVDGTTFSFVGQRRTFKAHDVRAVHLARQRLNLGSHAFICLLFLPLYALIAYLLRVLFGLPLFAGMLICYSVVPIGLLVGLSTKWVCISFTSSEDGVPSTAYFADGGSRGWRGIFGGTHKMFAEIREHLAAYPQSAHHPPCEPIAP